MYNVQFTKYKGLVRGYGTGIARSKVSLYFSGWNGRKELLMK